MASWHARASSDDGNVVEIVYHIPITVAGAFWLRKSDGTVEQVN